MPLELQCLSEQAFDVACRGIHLVPQVLYVEVNQPFHAHHHGVAINLCCLLPRRFIWLLLSNAEILDVSVLIPEV